MIDGSLQHGPYPPFSTLHSAFNRRVAELPHFNDALAVKGPDNVLQRRLVIELDGAQHLDRGVIEYDAKRDEFLQSKGMTVLHVDNQELEESLGKVLWRIEKVAEELRRLKGAATTRRFRS